MSINGDFVRGAADGSRKESRVRPSIPWRTSLLTSRPQHLLGDPPRRGGVGVSNFYITENGAPV